MQLLNVCYASFSRACVSIALSTFPLVTSAIVGLVRTLQSTILPGARLLDTQLYPYPLHLLYGIIMPNVAYNDAGLNQPIQDRLV